MSLLNDLEMIYQTMPTIKRIVVDKRTWDRISFEMQQIQRFGVNGAAVQLMAPMMFRDVEIWHDKQEVAPED